MISKTIGFRGFLYFQTNPNDPNDLPMASKPWSQSIRVFGSTSAGGEIQQLRDRHSAEPGAQRRGV